MTRTVFLSSTGEDLHEYREAAYKAIEGLDGHHCVRMEDFGARGSTSEEFCSSRAAECDLFVGIIGHLYGNSPAGTDRSFTEIEYESATAASRPTLMFLSPDDFPLPANLVEPDERRSRQRHFRDRISAATVRASFSTPSDLAWKVVQAIMNQELQRDTPEEIVWQTPNVQLERMLAQAQRELLLAQRRLQEQEEIISSLLIASTQASGPPGPSTAPVEQPVATFTVDSGSVRQGDHITVQIILATAPPGVGAVDLQVSYDNAKLCATSCAGTRNVVGNHAFAPNTVAFSGANIEGWAGSVVWGEITFLALPTAAPGPTQVTPSLQTLADTSGANIGPGRLVAGLVHILVK